MGNSYLRNVQRDGIHMFDAIFWCNDLPAIVGKKVVVVWDLMNVNQVLVFDPETRRYLCTATHDPHSSRLVDEEQYRESKRRKRLVANRARQLDNARIAAIGTMEVRHG